MSQIFSSRSNLFIPAINVRFKPLESTEKSRGWTMVEFFRKLRNQSSRAIRIPEYRAWRVCSGSWEICQKEPLFQAGSIVYEGALVKAVESFQQRHGLTADGRIDAKTLAELNVPLSRRLRQMELTLERWRWLPDEYQHSPIVVNVPEFQLRAYGHDFKIAVTMKVVVGKAYKHDTPIFMSKMRSVIFRPHWNVPLSIAKAETIPSLKRNPAYLAKENMEIVDIRGNVVSSANSLRGNVPGISNRASFRSGSDRVPIIRWGSSNSCFRTNSTSICTTLRRRNCFRDHSATLATAASGWKTPSTWRHGSSAIIRAGTLIAFAPR